MPALRSESLFTINITVAYFHDLGPTQFGTRHIVMFGAGIFAGPDLRGEVLPGGRHQTSTAPTVR